MLSSTLDLEKSANVIMMLGPGEGLTLTCLGETLPLEVSHFGVVVIVLSQVVSIEGMVLLLLEVIAIELVVKLILLLFLACVLFDLLLAGSIFASYLFQ